VPSYARIPLLAVLAAALAAVLTGAAPPPEPAVAPAVAAPTVTGPLAADSFSSARTYAEVAPPVRLRIPELGVDSRLDRLGVRPDGSVEVPARVSVAGWFAGGPRPGQAGPAVILGHVDSRNGPGIFARLATVRPGARIRVDRADGSTVIFRITSVSRVPKTRFPTDLVYAPTLEPSLRLVTCGGDFDRTRRSYRDNVIAFAEPI
jgi:hypothetical protein